MIDGRGSLETHKPPTDPMALACLLYRHAASAIRDARHDLARGDRAGRSEAIGKALAILGELNS